MTAVPKTFHDYLFLPLDALQHMKQIVRTELPSFHNLFISQGFQQNLPRTFCKIGRNKDLGLRHILIFIDIF